MREYHDDADYVASLRIALVPVGTPAAEAARAAPYAAWRIGRSRGHPAYGLLEHLRDDRALVVAVITDPTDQRGRADIEDAVRAARDEAAEVEVCLLAVDPTAPDGWGQPLAFTTVGRVAQEPVRA